MTTTLPPEVQWGRWVAEDLSLLSRLHARELDSGLWAGLQAAQFPNGAMFVTGSELLRESLNQNVSLDQEAAEYSSIYLTGEYHATPHESAWTDEEGLLRQSAMFEVRGVLEKSQFVVRDWANFPEDHLGVQLEFLAALVGRGDQASWTTAAEFLKAHPLKWINLFAQKVTARSGSQFYAGLSQWTAEYLWELRRGLESALDLEILDRANLAVSVPKAPPAEESRFMPGQGPSW